MFFAPRLTPLQAACPAVQAALAALADAEQHYELCRRQQAADPMAFFDASLRRAGCVNALEDALGAADPEFAALLAEVEAEEAHHYAALAA